MDYVVIVDDDVGVRGSLVEMVSALGLATKAYSSADTFLQSHDSFRASCVILDMLMPGVSGIELVGVVVEELSPVPVIVITGAEVDQGSVISAGAFAFFEKPYRPKEFRGSLQRALAHGRTEPDRARHFNASRTAR